MQFYFNPDDVFFFGRYAKSLRMKKGLSLRGLAEKADCTHAQIIAIEKGREMPSDDMVKRLAKALKDDTPLADLTYQMELCALRSRIAHRMNRIIDDCGSTDALFSAMEYTPPL